MKRRCTTRHSKTQARKLRRGTAWRTFTRDEIIAMRRRLLSQSFESEYLNVPIDDLENGLGHAQQYAEADEAIKKARFSPGRIEAPDGASPATTEPLSESG